jgi:copper transport protein
MTNTRGRGGMCAALVALACVPVGIGVADPAAAHTTFVSSSPADGQVLKSAPKQVRLTFSEKVTPKAKGFALRTGGAKVATGTAFSSGKSVLVPIKGSPAGGTYVLSYSVAGADKHPVKGTVTFRIKK